MLRTVFALAALCAAVPAVAQQQHSVMNVSGLEYSSNPSARVNYDYVAPSDATLASIKARRFWGIRLPINVEQLQPDPTKATAGLLNEQYVAVIIDAASRAQRAGLTVIVDVHNFGRYWGNPINLTSTDPSRNIRSMYLGIAGALAKRLQAAGVWGFSLTNEPHDIAVADLQSVEQDAVNVVRAAGYRNLIIVDNAGWANGWNGLQVTVKDPGPLCYDVHAYGDGDGSGTYKLPYAQNIDVSTGKPVNGDTMTSRVRPAVEQAAREGRCLFIGEIGAPLADANWRQQVLNVAEYLRQVQVDWAYWDAGDWTGDDRNSIQAGLTSNAASGAQSLITALPANR